MPSSRFTPDDLKTKQNRLCIFRSSSVVIGMAADTKDKKRGEWPVLGRFWTIPNILTLSRLVLALRDGAAARSQGSAKAHQCSALGRRR